MRKFNPVKSVGLVFILLGLAACGAKAPKSKAVYMLIDTSGTYTRELDKAQKIGNYLLGSLNSGDSLAMARIDSGSFLPNSASIRANRRTAVSELPPDSK